MNDRQKAVLKGFLNLTTAEKAEVQSEIGSRAGRLNERIEKGEDISMGPVAGGCPCCGK